MVLSTNSQKLSPKQLNAIPLLATGVSGKDVASAINVNPATVSQWINHNQDFRSALKAFSVNSLSMAETQLESLSLEAIAELKRLLVGAKSEQVRFKVIEMILTAVGLCGGQKGNGQGEPFATDAARYDFNKLIDSLTGG